MWLIDDTGTLGHVASTGMRERLGNSSLGATQLINFAVVNMGFAAIQQRRRHWIVRFEPRHITPDCHCSLLHWLRNVPDATMALSWPVRAQWLHRIVNSRAAAIGVVSHVLEHHRALSQELETRLQARRINPSNTPLAATETMATSILQVAIASPHRKLMLDALFAGRWTLAHKEASSERIEILEMGAGYPVFDDGWMSAPRGRTYFDLADGEYARFVTQSHLAVAEEAHANFHLIDAVVHWPMTGRAHLKYERMILPVSTSAGMQLLLNATRSVA